MNSLRMFLISASVLSFFACKEPNNTEVVAELSSSIPNSSEFLASSSVLSAMVMSSSAPALSSSSMGPTVAIPGFMTDARDGHEYATVQINGVNWMAENLRYMPDTTSSRVSFSGGYVDCDSAWCDTLGAFYSISTLDEACPAGWKVPTLEDWNALARAHSSDSLLAGLGMRSTSFGSGLNTYGFNVKGTSFYSTSEMSYHLLVSGIGSYSEFWTTNSTVIGYTWMDIVSIDSTSGYSSWQTNFADDYSIRCIQAGPTP